MYPHHIYYFFHKELVGFMIMKDVALYLNFALRLTARIAPSPDTHPTPNAITTYGAIYKMRWGSRQGLVGGVLSSSSSSYLCDDVVNVDALLSSLL
jgi:hypothetical protein